MTGYDVFKRSLNLLGYTDSDDRLSPNNDLYLRSIHIINQIAVDLKQDEISDMNAEINMPQRLTEALPYGVAMLLALSSGDANKNSLFAEIYNAKRASALCEKQTVEDKLPYVVLGED